MGLGAYVPQLVVVHPAVPAKSMNELIDLAKAQPGKINFGSPGAGTVGHLSIEFFNATSGAKFTHVPYKGAGPGLIDLVGEPHPGVRRQRHERADASRGGKNPRDRDRPYQAIAQHARPAHGRRDTARILQQRLVWHPRARAHACG